MKTLEQFKKESKDGVFAKLIELGDKLGLEPIDIEKQAFKAYIDLISTDGNSINQEQVRDLYITRLLQ